MTEPRTYEGIDNDRGGGMSPTAKIIRDAWAFGLIPETETCAGWLPHQIEALWVKANDEWERYGFRVGAMPPDLQARYLAIQKAATERAKADGWSGEADLANDT